MELAKIKSNLPLKAYPKHDIDKIVIVNILPLISQLLSLTDEVSAKRLEIALPAIKEHCWSMGFNEIKKMFEMYVDNKLALKPIPNYFDRILLGKIIIAYKQQKKMSKINEVEYKKFQDDINTITCFDSFIQDNKINDDNYWIYTYLESKGIINYSKEEKNKVKEICKQNAKPNEDVIILSKVKLLERFFGNLESKGKHIKTLL